MGEIGGVGRIGIIAALHEEIAGLLAAMEAPIATHRIGMREYHLGRLFGRDCVLVLARIGKVAAAATTATLIQAFSVDLVLCTGLAGGIGKHVRVGDVVVAQALMQHDLDARPICPRYEVPLLERAVFEVDLQWALALEDAAREYVEGAFQDDVDLHTRDMFGIDMPAVHTGLICSGDQFIGDRAAVEVLTTALPQALCVEMESAAVAQVCYECGVPCLVLRIVSDRADDCASRDFVTFLQTIGSVYSAGIVRTFLAAGLAFDAGRHEDGAHESDGERG